MNVSHARASAMYKGWVALSFSPSLPPRSHDAAAGSGSTCGQATQQHHAKHPSSGHPRPTHRLPCIAGTHAAACPPSLSHARALTPLRPACAAWQTARPPAWRRTWCRRGSSASPAHPSGTQAREWLSRTVAPALPAPAWQVASAAQLMQQAPVAPRATAQRLLARRGPYSVVKARVPEARGPGRSRRAPAWRRPARAHTHARMRCQATLSTAPILRKHAAPPGPLTGCSM